jgi:site-specific recombinase XerD
MQVILKPLYHRRQECIGIYFEKNSLLQQAVQQEAAAKWSKTYKCWYVTCTGENYIRLKSALENKARIVLDELKRFLLEKKEDRLTPSVFVNKKSAGTTAINPANAITKVKQPSIHSHAWGKENTEAFQQFSQQLVLKGYSQSTRRTYENEFRQFLQTIKGTPAKDFSVPRLKDYFQYCYSKLKLSENTMHSRINALKFYYEQVLGREKFFWEIPRPKKQQQLPKIFSQDEVAAIINSVSNKKHKVMLMLAYSAGLRISEVVNIRAYQIDSKRMTIFVSQAKGKKDRIVTLSPVLLVMLREYAKQYKPDKKGYLFEGSTPGAPYSTRSLQEVLQAAKKKAGVMKPGSVHTLRHSFATHLIEKGTDVTMIQKLLGHNDLKTTLIYLHTSNQDLLKVISPLDDLKLT